MIDAVSEAYSRRAAEYTELFGSMGAVHPSDRQLVSTWADGVDGQVIDAGCGPGHWTNFLAERGLEARGIDLVPEFIARARSAYPGVSFEVGSLNTLDVETGTVGGVLSWYSLIHHDPSTIGIPLQEFNRVLRPGGMLLLGFFESPAIEGFAHAMAAAYRWPVSDLTEELTSAGFDVIETHTRTTTDQRPHAAIIARRASAE
ncbi:class I SAM-dependent methyltransferase [Arthrobacter antioxidans]|uniref:class I SAM-dependent methyltransferase n=1 Tax=Arthrobacter antioxidans TaxID=2895818 RepID=UPI001FFECF61|nr:class I SAM-dependent methyltransferase [Arthrobacter antioxidans]